MKSRPVLNKKIQVGDFKAFYWLKEELIGFCREQNLPQSGSKKDLTDRIALFLETGQVESVPKRETVQSKFDWSTERLSRKTIITDSYKNCQNVRDYFSREIGKPFKFNIAFMAWMKANQGKTLEDAIEEWKRLEEQKRDPKFKTKIPPSLEYNRFTRDYYADNPGAKREEVIKAWKAKRSKPGHNRYERDDVERLED